MTPSLSLGPSAAAAPVDSPDSWDPRTKQQRRVALADFSAAPWQGFEKSERCPSLGSLFPPQAAVASAAVRVLYRPPKQKDLTRMSRAASFLVDIPMRWEPRAKQQQRVALADFSAAPWQGFEKSEHGPNNSSLFQAAGCGRRRCTGLIAYSASQSRPVRVLYRPAPTWVSG